MSYSLNDLRKKFDLSYDKDNDKEYWGKNANKGHYWANDNDGNKVYLGHNDNLSSLLNNSELEDASGSTKYDHDTDVARGLAGLLNHDPSKKIDKPKKAEPKEEPYVKSKELADAETTIAKYQADQEKGKHANWIKRDISASSPAPANFDSVKAHYKGEAMDIAKNAAQDFYKDYSANLIKEMKEDKENENPVLV